MKSRIFNSSFGRIALVTFLTLIIAVAATCLIALSLLSGAVEEKQRAIERQAAMKLRGYVMERFTSVSELLDSSSTRMRLGSCLADIAAKPDLAYNYDNIEYLLDFTNNALLLDKDLQDCILVVEGGMVYSQTRVQYGDAVASYDFLGDALYADFLSGNAAFGMISDNTERYTIGNSCEVLSMLWAIYDPTRLPVRDRVGFLIVNIPQENLDAAYADFQDVMQGDLQLIGSGNAVIYDAGRFDSGEIAATPIDYPMGVMGYSIRSLLPENLIASERAELLRRTAEVFLLVAGVSLLIIGLVVHSYNKRSQQLIDTMRRVQEGHLKERALVARRDEIGEISEAFNVMAEQLEQYIDRTYTAEIARRDSEVALLQSQINPHFLYNALENMSMMAAQRGQDDLADFAADLGQLFRISIRSTDLIVPIDSELQYVQLYINIQTVRFGDALLFEIDADPELRNYAIPKLILQPLVENAVIHGHRDLKPGAWVKIIVERAHAPGMVRFCVRDNGQGMDRVYSGEMVPASKRSIGLPNSAQRIRLMFGEGCALRVDSVPGEGTSITFRLPLMTVEEMKAYVQLTDRR